MKKVLIIGGTHDGRRIDVNDNLPLPSVLNLRAVRRASVAVRLVGCAYRDYCNNCTKIDSCRQPLTTDADDKETYGLEFLHSGRGTVFPVYLIVGKSRSELISALLCGYAAKQGLGGYLSYKRGDAVYGCSEKDTPIESITTFSVRARKAFLLNGIVRLGDLMNKTEAELLCFNNFGPKTLRNVRETMRDMGLPLLKERRP